MRFLNKKHKSFFEEMMMKASAQGNRYLLSMFYILGLTNETRQHIYGLYDFQKGSVIYRGLEEPWQTGTTQRLTRLAFNLFNGFFGEDFNKTIDEHELYTPYYLFCTDYMEYCFEAIRMRNSRLVSAK